MGTIKVFNCYAFYFAAWLLFCNVPLTLAQAVSFLPAPDLSVIANCCDVVSGDFNGDGKVDLMVSDFATGTLQLLLGDGRGGFQRKVVPGVVSSYPRLIASDVNRDGKLDLLI